MIKLNALLLLISPKNNVTKCHNFFIYLMNKLLTVTFCLLVVDITNVVIK